MLWASCGRGGHKNVCQKLMRMHDISLPRCSGSYCTGFDMFVMSGICEFAEESAQSMMNLVEERTFFPSNHYFELAL